MFFFPVSSSYVCINHEPACRVMGGEKSDEDDEADGDDDEGEGGDEEKDVRFEGEGEGEGEGQYFTLPH
jgi:hypothetical protein